MATHEDYHADLSGIARVLPKGIFNRYTLPVLRRLTKVFELRKPKDVEVLTLPTGVGIRLHRPQNITHEGCALLWIHGGGYVIGSAAQDDALCRRYAKQLGVPVAAVDYRLAPKHPYPAALEDCYQALTWLAGQSGVDADRIAIGGASAGGGLTAALALLARDRGEVAPLFQLLVYPMVDDRSSDLPPNPRYRLWNPDTNRIGWTAYLGDADPDVAVPARRTDLAGVAPAWVGVGSLDPLHDEDVGYAARLTESGVACQLDVVAGAFHGFDAVHAGAGISRSFFARQCDALRAAFTRA